MDEPTDRPTSELEAIEPMTEAPSGDLTRPDPGDDRGDEALSAEPEAEAPVPSDEAGSLPEEAPTPEDRDDAELEPSASLGESRGEAAIEAADPEVETGTEPEPEVETELEVEAEAEVRDVSAEPAETGKAEAPAEAVPATEAAPGEEPDDGRRWYVVHCYSGYEGKVRHNLEQRIESMGMKSKIFDVVIPTEEEIEVKDGKRRTVERHVFPGYILVQMLMDEDSWYVVRNTPGVTGFVGMGNEPTPLRPEEVQQIIRRMEAEAPRVKVTYKAGQRVRIIDGPFNDFIGTVDEIDMERAKVRVMVSFFGRETPVELDFLQVEKA